MRSACSWGWRLVAVAVAVASCQVFDRGQYDLLITELPTDVPTAPDVVVADAYVPPAPQRIGWAPGWDRFDFPYEVAASSATITQPLRDRVHASIRIVGLVPNSNHMIGLHLIWATESQCLIAFGQYRSGGCGTSVRQGNTAVFNYADVGVVGTDAAGILTSEIDFNGLDPGSYAFELHLRVGSCMDGTPDGCLVALQAPGPRYGTGTVVVTVR
jgi:hypothetical protein